MENNTCRSCGWKEKNTLGISDNIWFAIYLAILMCGVAFLNGSII